MRFLALIGILLILTVFSCKNNNKNISPDILALEEKILNQKQTELVDELNNKYLGILQDTILNETDKKQVTEHALDFFTNINKSSFSSYYLYELIKNYKLSDHKERTKQFIKLIDDNGNKELSKTMKVLYASKYSDDKKYISTFSEEIKGNKIDYDRYLKSVADNMYANIEKIGNIDPLEARNYINSCEVYALVNPESKESPKYLYLAAQVAQNIKMYLKTVELYDWVITKYPEFEKNKTAMFMKGFVLDNDLKYYNKAKKVYHEFLKKYPNSDLSDDVKSALELLGKSDEEIIKIIESKNIESKNKG